MEKKALRLISTRVQFTIKEMIMPYDHLPGRKPTWEFEMYMKKPFPAGTGYRLTILDASEP